MADVLNEICLDCVHKEKISIVDGDAFCQETWLDRDGGLCCPFKSDSLASAIKTIEDFFKLDCDVKTPQEAWARIKKELEDK